MFAEPVSHIFFLLRHTLDLRVLAGERILSRRLRHAQQRRVRRVIIHKDYLPSTFDNDIALLQLNRPLQFTSRVQPVCTFTNKTEEENMNFSACFISGWGSTQYDGLSQT